MIRIRRPKYVWLLALAAALPVRVAAAADIDADPGSYEAALASLQPGDTLHLAAGTYPDLLVIQNLNGSETDWITIEGPASGDPAVFLADPGPCCNTVEIRNSSYVAIKNLTIDGNGVGGAFGISAKDGTSNLVHHITVEGCTFLNHDAGQQTVAISTKTPTWGWTIRGNRIVGAGTGMYLGNSNGNDPFVAGLVEYNLVDDTLGYNVQIKWQNPRPDVAGMPAGPSSTVIRHNVFIKRDRPSPSGDRPNLLVGGFPDSGPGAEDLYEIYGNVFYHNPRESLMQASGRVSIHDNLFVDVDGTALLLRNHDLPLSLARVYNNTVYGAGRGIHVGSTATQGASVFGNLVFADTPVSGTIDDERDNITDAIANAAQYVASPSTVLGAMDFYPLAGQCEGPAIDLSPAAVDLDYDVDFNGTPKGGFTFRGAYAGDGPNPGWAVDEEIKDPTGGASGAGGSAGAAGASGGSGAGGDGGASGSGGSATGGSGGAAAGSGGTTAAGSGGSPAATGSGDDDGGCSCRAAGSNAGHGWLGLGGCVLLLVRRRVWPVPADRSGSGEN